ncbi:S-layer homology domain-containing protein [Schinkia azotoformans]|uniref:S-layer homology domain-containing protein n=1 Tax=Schinkia azotoformans TaxID=1454 RepID=UPI002DBD4C6B|nr:S-layer homology domain-containing protein [Schinkia azotoformans]MEC1771884.1 S-layer homology domain-containing protein [Schinkia azotoformans]MED4366382.1 S-layer homology domain-containing protein [Schinkia azotoformans]
MSNQLKRLCKKFVAVVVSLTVVSSMTVTSRIPNVEAASSFRDVSNHAFYYEAVTELAQRGVLGGYEDGTFKPNRPVTRAEATKIIAFDLGLAYKNVYSYSPFRDVVASDWFYQPVTALTLAGGIGGYGDGTFRPNQTITRAEMASLLVKAYQLSTNRNVYLPFQDIPANSWYASAVKVLYANQVTSGKSAVSFAPNDAVTRGEMAAFVHKAGKVSKEVEESPVNQVPWVNSGVLEKITSNSVKISGLTYSMVSGVKNILGTHNDAVLNGAKIEVEQSNGLIKKIEKLELNKSGRSSSKVVLDGKNGTIDGDLVISADYVTVENMTVQGDFIITNKLKNDFYAEDLNVRSDTMINSDDGGKIVFEDSKLQAVKVNSEDVRIEARGSATANYFIFTKDATIISEKTISKIIVDKKDVDLILGTNTKVYNIELPRSVDLKDVVASRSQRENIEHINGWDNPEYDPYDYYDDDDDDDDDVRYINGGHYGKLTIREDAHIRNVSVDELILDPGNNGDVTLNNVEVDYITIKSGGTNSIRLIDTTVFKTITVENDRTIRIVFGSGTDVNRVILETAAILDAGTSNADINEVEIRPTSGNDVISFNGDAFSDTYVTVSKPAFVETVRNTELRKITVTAETGSVFLETATETLYISGKAEVIIDNAKIKDVIMAALQAVLNIRSSATITGTLTILADGTIKVANQNSIAHATLEKAPGIYVNAAQYILDQIKVNPTLKPVGSPLEISSISASNGNIAVMLNREPPGGLAADNFTFTISINGGEPKTLDITKANTGSNPATFTFEPIQKTAAKQMVTIVATYYLANGEDLTKSTSFVVDEKENHVPVAQTVTVDPIYEGGGPIEFTASQLATDLDRDELTIVGATSSNLDVATARIEGGKLIITPAADVSGDGVTIVAVDVSDGKEKVTVTFEVVVKNSNHAPVAEIVTVDPVYEGAPAIEFTASQLATDPDGDELTIVGATSSNLDIATARIEGGKLIITPAVDVSGDGVTTVTVDVSDGKEKVTVTFEVVVKNINHAPVAEKVTVAPVIEGAPAIEFTVSQLATDPDGDELTIVGATSSNPDIAAVKIEAGKLIIIPAVDVSGDGVTTVTVDVSDGKEKVTVTFEVVVKNSNHAPIAEKVTVAPVIEGTPAIEFTASQLATDPDGDELTIVGATSSNPDIAAVRIEAGKLIVTPAADVVEDGVTTVEVDVSDGKETIQVAFTLQVKNIKYAISLPMRQLNERETARYTVPELVSDEKYNSYTFVPGSVTSTKTEVATATIGSGGVLEIKANEVATDTTTTITVEVTNSKGKILLTFDVNVKNVKE